MISINERQKKDSVVSSSVAQPTDFIVQLFDECMMLFCMLLVSKLVVLTFALFSVTVLVAACEPENSDQIDVENKIEQVD